MRIYSSVALLLFSLAFMPFAAGNRSQIHHMYGHGDPLSATPIPGQDYFLFEHSVTFSRVNPTTGEKITNYFGADFYQKQVSVSPNGLTFTASGTLFGQDGVVCLWEIESGRLLHKFVLPGSFTAPQPFYSIDGNLIFIPTLPDVQLLDPQTGEILGTINIPADHGMVGVIKGDLLMLQNINTSDIVFWDWENETAIQTFTSPGGLYGNLDCSEDGSHLLTPIMGETAHLWDTETATILHTFSGFSGNFNTAFFADNGAKIMLIAGSDAHLYRTSDQELLQTFSSAGEINQRFSISSDESRLLLGAQDGTTRLYNTESGAMLAEETIATPLQEFSSLATLEFLDSDSHFIARSNYSEFFIYESSTMTLANSFLFEHTVAFRGARYSNDESEIFAVGGRGRFARYAADTGELTQILGVGTFSETSRFAVSPSETHAVLVGDTFMGSFLTHYDISTGEILYQGSPTTLPLVDCAISPDDTIIVASSLNSVEIWDPDQPDFATTFALIPAALNRVKFTCDGSKLLVAYGGDFNFPGFPGFDGEWATVLAFPSGTPMNLINHTADVMDITDTPDGSKYLTASLDSTVRIWDAADGAELAVLTHETSVHSVAVSPDGSIYAAGLAKGEIVFWNAATLEILSVFAIPDIEHPVTEIKIKSDNQFVLWVIGNYGILFETRIYSDYCAVGPSEFHSADIDQNNSISLSELLRVVQLYNMQGYSCDCLSEDGFAPGAGSPACDPHDSDYAPQDWQISLIELLRLIQIYNSHAYVYCPDSGEDGFCPTAQ